MFPNSAAVHLLSGTLGMLRQDVTASARAFIRALEIQPDSVEALNGLVTSDLQAGRAAAARSRLEAFLQRRPDSVEALMMTAQIAMMQKQPAVAEQVLRRVVELHPENFDAYSALGTLYLAQNKVREARAEFVNVTKENPRSVGAHTLVGILSQLLNEPADAERSYKQALQVDGQAAVAANNLAWIYAEQGQNLDVAVELAKGASERLPNHAEASDTLGWAYYKADLLTSAVPMFERAVERNPRNPVYHYHLGMAHFRNRDEGRARASLRRALELNGSFNGAAEARQALAQLE
jgi:Tfp pilus assembly protein PilF